VYLEVLLLLSHPPSEWYQPDESSSKKMTGGLQ
jgi:hypothetical protein